jgi:hypothetical protein
LKKIFSFLLLCWLTCCTLNTVSRAARPVGFTEILQLDTDIAIEKVCYNSIEQITYIWESNTEEIHVFEQNIQVNTIGGIGFDRTSFQNLADICLSPDGDLFALDSVERSLKKFDKKGDFIAQIQMDSNLSPQMVAVSLDQKIYIYDDKRKEIVVLNYKGKEIETFGSLQFNEPACLELYNDLLAVYDPENENTMFFSRFGQIVDQQNGHCYIDNQQIYCAQKFFLEHIPEKHKYAINTLPWQKIFFQSPEIILSDGKKILVGMIKYESDQR